MASALRAVLRATLLPTLRAGRPLEQQRRRLRWITALTLAPRGVEFRAHACGGIPGEMVAVRGRAPASRAVLYLHGGGYCVGSPATHRAITGNLARLGATRVFAADYRLAPEHPFPAAIDDAVAAYRGLLDSGCEGRQIAIGGDSAGGGLALATTLRLGQLALPMPGALVLFSPWVDLARQHPEPAAANEVMLGGAWIAECARFYAGNRVATEPLVSPVSADLRGLPSTLIQVGADEALLADAQRLHAALGAAGVQASLQEFPRRWHVFQINAGLLADANRALAAAGRFLIERLDA